LQTSNQKRTLQSILITMNIQSATFKRGIVGDDEILHNGTPQVAFIGRSNAGKSSLLNTLCNKKKLAISSKTPGRTKEINIFHINESHYFVDLPGYGYAKTSGAVAEKLYRLINWYLFNSEHRPKVVVLIDSFVGPTKDDLVIIENLEEVHKDIVIVLNKIDKVKSSKRLSRIKELTKQFSKHKVFACSSQEKIGIEALRAEVLG